MNDFFSPSHYVSREKELAAISFGLKEKGAVVITGHAGTGKTVLAKMYAQQHSNSYRRVYYYSARMFDRQPPDFDGAYLPHATKEPLLAVVDGIDEISAEFGRKPVIKHFTEAVRYGHKVIFTHRPYMIYDPEEYGVHEIQLGGLSQAETWQLFAGLMGYDASAKFREGQLDPLFQAVENNPLGIVATASLLKTGNVNPNDIFAKLYDRLDYSDNLIGEFMDSRIILPQPPQIISQVGLINTSLVEKVKAHPSYIYSMTPRQFEEFVAELFEKEGYAVSLTKQTRDGGKDLFIAENKRLGNFIYYLECKRFSPEIPVGVRFVRELYGTIVADRATAGVLITSSYFSKEARHFTEKVKTQLSLMDYVDLKKWIDDLSKGNI